MKKLLVTSLLTAILTSTMQADGYKSYFGLGVAMQNVENPNIDNGAAVVVNGGRSFYRGLGLEVEGTMSVRKMEGDYSVLNQALNRSTLRDEIDFWSVGMYSTYVWKLGNISVKPRVGVLFESIKSDNLTLEEKKTSSAVIAKGPATDKNGLALSAGIGFAYEFGENFDIYTNYTRIEDEINHLTFGAKFKF